jgi:2-polyprenyl-3-methyl-5-hydroxy-6-metoxy-1,4-benzoquinol methylase
MSKYLQRGCYHFQEFANPNTTYAKHVDDLIGWLRKLVGEDPNVLAIDVGCGEGLIMNQLELGLGWKTEGHDIDEIAISMAKRLCPRSTIHKSSEMIGYNPGCDVILFCDSLEHMSHWREQLEWAKPLTNWLVIAVPDRHDPHGEQDFKPDFADTILSEWGDIVHRATRHARHLTIWKRK